MKPRKAAATALINILEQKRFSNEEAAHWLEQSEWSSEDQRLFIKLIYGTLDQLMLIDDVIKKHSTRDIQKLDPLVRNILRVSVYQLLFTDRIPVYAVVNEAVAIIRGQYPGASGFVNAVLRAVDRDKRDGPVIIEPSVPSVKSLSRHYSHPKWMIRRLMETYSPDELTAILKNHQEPPELTIRLNTLKGSVDRLLIELEKDSIATERTDWMPESLKVTQYHGLITQSAAYTGGLFQIQSISSMLAVHFFDPQPGELIIDVAAAPGGKTMHMAQRMNNQGLILARDISATRVRQIERHAERLGVSIVRTEVRDGTLKDIAGTAFADRVLLDAPCSSLGMIRKKPELKYLKTEPDLDYLPSLQLALLNQSAELLKPGGLLMYATCTYLQEENHHVVDSFLEQHPEFSPAGISALSEMDPFTGFAGTNGRLQLGPHIHPDLDGFFMAKMKKEA